MSIILDIVQNFLYYAIGVAVSIAGVTVFADVYSRKSKKEEYLSELETLERIHASKRVSEAIKEPEAKTEEKKQ
jgi:hypothetical protein